MASEPVSKPAPPKNSSEAKPEQEMDYEFMNAVKLNLTCKDEDKNGDYFAWVSDSNWKLRYSTVQTFTKNVENLKFRLEIGIKIDHASIPSEFIPATAKLLSDKNKLIVAKTAENLEKFADLVPVEYLKTQAEHLFPALAAPLGESAARPRNCGVACLKIWLEKAGLAVGIEHLRLEEQLVKPNPFLKSSLMETLGEVLLKTVPEKKEGASPFLEPVTVYVLKALKDRDVNVRRAAEKMLSGVIYHIGERHVMQVAISSDFDALTQAENHKAIMNCLDTKAKKIVPVLQKPKKFKLESELVLKDLEIASLKEKYEILSKKFVDQSAEMLKLKLGLLKAKIEQRKAEEKAIAEAY